MPYSLTNVAHNRASCQHTWPHLGAASSAPPLIFYLHLVSQMDHSWAAWAVYNQFFPMWPGPEQPSTSLTLHWDKPKHTLSSLSCPIVCVLYFFCMFAPKIYSGPDMDSSISQVWVNPKLHVFTILFLQPQLSLNCSVLSILKWVLTTLLLGGPHIRVAGFIQNELTMSSYFLLT